MSFIYDVPIDSSSLIGRDISIVIVLGDEVYHSTSTLGRRLAALLIVSYRSDGEAPRLMCIH